MFALPATKNLPRSPLPYRACFLYDNTVSTAALESSSAAPLLWARVTPLYLASSLASVLPARRGIQPAIGRVWQAYLAGFAPQTLLWSASRPHGQKPEVVSTSARRPDSLDGALFSALLYARTSRETSSLQWVTEWGHKELAALAAHLHFANSR